MLAVMTVFIMWKIVDINVRIDGNIEFAIHSL